MENDNPPRAGEISATCPNPDLVACRRAHFGREVWHFECAQAVEVSAGDRGIVIKCCGLDGFCCVEEGKDVFVGSPDINPFNLQIASVSGMIAPAMGGWAPLWSERHSHSYDLSEEQVQACMGKRGPG